MFSLYSIDRSIVPVVFVSLIWATAGCGSSAETPDSEATPPSNNAFQCGNGTIDDGEACDNGDRNSDIAADACRTDCTRPICGDGVIDATEACDDGSDNSDEASDACRTNCRLPSCGDGVVDTGAGESCEAGVDAAGSPVTCRLSCGFCGDAIVQPDAGETCDNGPDNSSDPSSSCLPNCQRVWRFVSVPDFLNADVGDVSHLTDEVNSTTPETEEAIGYVLDTIAQENPDFVLVAGDLVNGRWLSQGPPNIFFGAAGNTSEQDRVNAIALAADTYFPAWLERFTARNLTVHVAIGDHDIGDNPWNAGSDKAHVVPTFRRNFGQFFNYTAEGTFRYEERPSDSIYADTAYAFRHENALFVSVDPFRQDTKGQTVTNDIAGEQLDWLRRVLGEAKDDPDIQHIFVQGHLPVLTPVRTQASSGLSLNGGANSAFWQTLVQHGVDIYLAGEVHDVSALNQGGVEQLAHGLNLGRADTVNYLVATVFPDRIELELKWAELEYPASPDTEQLWQISSNRPVANYTFKEPGFISNGTLVIDKSSGDTVFRDRSQFLELYQPNGPSVPEGLILHYPMDSDDPSEGRLANQGTTGQSYDLSMSAPASTDFADDGAIGRALVLQNGNHGSTSATSPVPISGSTPRTVSVWVRTPVGGGTDLRALVSLGTNIEGGKWDLDIDYDQNGRISLGVGSGRMDGTNQVSVDDGNWHHIAAVLPASASNLSGARLFVDGEAIGLEAPNTNRTIATTAAPFLVGRTANSENPENRRFAGDLDDIAVWNRDLSAIEVRTLFSVQSALAYNARQAEQLFAAFRSQTDVTIRDQTFSYVSGGLSGEAGVVDASSQSLNLRSGAGFRISAAAAE